MENKRWTVYSLTSRSKVPNLLAAIWTSGRETILVSDQLDRTTKEAIAATLSSINDCPYCGDMLISLVQAGDRADDARQILREEEEAIADPVLRERLSWVKAVATPGHPPPDSTPFAEAQLPEVVGTIMAMSDINRFSHIVMDGSPVNAPLGLVRVKEWSLRLFGSEVRPTHSDDIRPGSTLHLLPAAPLPEDLHWASANPRIAKAIARWTAAVEREAQGVITEAVHERVHHQLTNWQGELMPMSRSWVDAEVSRALVSDALESAREVPPRAATEAARALACASLARGRREDGGTGGGKPPPEGRNCSF